MLASKLGCAFGPALVACAVIGCAAPTEDDESSADALSDEPTSNANGDLSASLGLLYLASSPTATTPRCTATVIAPTVILTAGSCTASTVGYFSSGKPTGVFVPAGQPMTKGVEIIESKEVTYTLSPGIRVSRLSTPLVGAKPVELETTLAKGSRVTDWGFGCDLTLRARTAAWPTLPGYATAPSSTGCDEGNPLLNVKGKLVGIAGDFRIDGDRSPRIRREATLVSAKSDVLGSTIEKIRTLREQWSR